VPIRREEPPILTPLADTVITCFPTTWRDKTTAPSAVPSRKSNAPSAKSHRKVEGAPGPLRRPPGQPTLPGGTQWTSPLGIVPLPPGVSLEEAEAPGYKAPRQRGDPKDHESDISWLAGDEPLNVLHNILKHLRFLRREPITSAHAL